LNVLVGNRGVIEAEAMGDDERGVDVTALDPLEQRAQVAVHGSLAAVDSERPVHHGQEQFTGRGDEFQGVRQGRLQSGLLGRQRVKHRLSLASP
jgi:hypothetical protein